MPLPELYRHSLVLLTDLYQLTMALGYWRCGWAERQAVFHLSFRQNPFGGGFALACGTSYVAEFLRELRFTGDDLQHLRTLNGEDGTRLFPEPFLDDLQSLPWTVDVDAVPEGTVVFARQPLVRVCGPLLQCQFLETALLNLVNFQTLLATKAARVCRAARGKPVLEFGLRRAQGIDGGLAASRASFIGGCAATSNVLAGKLFGIPVRGTHAHSWVMVFSDELSAYRAYAEALPANCIFLVDTYDTLRGVGHAITVARELRARGREMQGIRLDSGDLLQLSRQARRRLDEAGFANAAIVASGDLDEYSIARLLGDGAPIDVFGVGTRLVTAYDQAALGGVYKLGAVRDEQGRWSRRAKRSDEAAKATDPGVLQVRRFRDARGVPRGDVIYDQELGFDPHAVLLPETAGDSAGEELLQPLFRAGRLVAPVATASESRARAAQQLAEFPEEILRQDEPQRYPLVIDPRLDAFRQPT
jgi:nicotinate phosphoribosyltransferase